LGLGLGLGWGGGTGKRCCTPVNTALVCCCVYDAANVQFMRTTEHSMMSGVVLSQPPTPTKLRNQLPCGVCCFSLSFEFGFVFVFCFLFRFGFYILLFVYLFF
jgi:hypothetical protein